MPVKLAFLGTGTCASTLHNTAAMAISDGSEIALIDCGGGCYHQISRLDSAFFSHDRIGTVLLTHFHADHSAGLIDLLWGEMWDPVLPRTAPLALAGPHGLARFFRECILPIIGEHHIPFDVRIVEMAPGDSYRGTFFSARSYQLSHTPSSTGYCLEIGSRKLGVTGDTGFCDNLLALLSSSDIAFMEWSNAGQVSAPFHLSDSDHVRLMQSGTMPREIYITHMYPVKGMTFDQQVAQKREILGKESSRFIFPRDLDVIQIS
jgi:ribonuclease BN (tRNA processing enzyme)